MKLSNLLFLCLLPFLSCTQSLENESDLPTNTVDSHNNDLYIERETSSVSSYDAQKIAMLFAGANGQTRTVSSVDEILEVTDEKSHTPLLYIVNWGQDKGYVVISASKNTSPIFAYSDKGRFVVSDENPVSLYLDEFKENVKKAKKCTSDSLRLKYALQWATYEKADFAESSTRALSGDMQQKLKNEVVYRESLGYKYLGGLSAARNYLPDNEYQLLLKQIEDCTDPRHDYMETTQLFIKSYNYEVIDKLLNTEWHQGSPFNVDAGNNLAGCVPIAVAQIVYYHKYPNKYNWSRIYEIPVLNDDFKYFIKDIRSLCKVEYNKDGTSSNIDKAKSALQSLGYKANKTDYDIRSELRSQIHAKNPVFMRGEKSNGKGHAWVCDGYENIKYDAIATFIPNKSDPRFKFEETSQYGFAAYGFSLYPPSSLSQELFGEFFHMNFGWANGYCNGWYRFNAYVPSLEESFLRNQKILTIQK